MVWRFILDVNTLLASIDTNIEKLKNKLLLYQTTAGGTKGAKAVTCTRLRHKINCLYLVEELLSESSCDDVCLSEQAMLALAWLLKDSC